MAQINGLERLVANLRGRAARAMKDVKVVVSVGFTAASAIYVHENMEAKNLGLNVPRRSGIGVYWGPHGGPKFLEGPARSLQPELTEIVKGAIFLVKHSLAPDTERQSFRTFVNQYLNWRIEGNSHEQTIASMHELMKF